MTDSKARTPEDAAGAQQARAQDAPPAIDAASPEDVATPAPWRIGPVAVTPLTGEAALAILARAVATRAGLRLAYANAHTVVLADRDPAYAETLSTFLVLPDGIGMDLAARSLRGEAFPENLNGTDFTPRLLAALPAGTRVFLLGGRPGVAAAAGEAWRRLGIDVVGARDGYFERVEHVAEEIEAAAPDVLLVAMGNPLQEHVIERVGEAAFVPLSIGVGALFDFTAGLVPRAPLWVRRARAEFLWRLAQEPRRLVSRYTVGVARFAGVVRRAKRPRNGTAVAR